MGRSTATRRARRLAGDGRPGQPRVAVVAPDPYLALALERDLPGSDLVTIRSAQELEAAPFADVDLIIVDLSDPRVRQVLVHRGEIPILGIARTTDLGDLRARCDAVLARPLGTAELRRAVHNLLGRADTDARQPNDWVGWVRAWLPALRVAAIAVAAVLEIAVTSVEPERALALALAFLYVALRAGLLRDGRVGVVSDVAVATLLVLATGGPVSSYTPFGLVVAVSAGLVLGIVQGVIAATFISLAGLIVLATSLVLSQLVEPVHYVSFAILFPLAAAAGGMAGRIWDVKAQRSSLSLLLEANRALSSLYRMARDMPGGLTPQRVAGAILQEAKAQVGGTAGLLLLEEAGSLHEAASIGLSDHPRVVLDVDELALSRRVGVVRLLDRGDVADVVAGAAPSDSRWAGVPLVGGGVLLGALLVAKPRGLDAGDRRALRRAAREGGVALHNARLFERLRELSVDEERVRLADELHDTVAQGLAHVRMELDFLARHGSELGDLRAEAGRVGGVVARTLADVRATIGELRAAVGPAGLAGALRDHARDLRGVGAPEIRMQVRTGVRCPPEVEVELFRIARDAITNGLRHAGVSQVTLSLEEHVGTLVLSVHDDGRPLDPGWDRRAGSEAARLKQIKDRVEQLGGRFEATRPDGGGNRLTVRYPLHRSDQDITVAGTRFT